MASDRIKEAFDIDDKTYEGMTDLGSEITESMLEAIEFLQGKGTARVTVIEIPDPAPRFSAKEIVELRNRLGMTQVRFAKLMNVSKTSVENWESGKKSPGPASRRLLQLANSDDAFCQFANLTGRIGSNPNQEPA